MKYAIFAFSLLGVLQPVKSQSSCTSDVAIPIDDALNSNSNSGSGSGGDPGVAAIASYQVAGASAIVDLTGTNLNSGGSGGPADLIDLGSDPPLRKLLRKRASLSCTSSEQCYSVQGDPFCANDQTGDFHLEDGTTGNLNTGDYELPDGQQGNLINGPYPTLAASGSATLDASATSAAGASDASVTTEAPESTDAITTGASSFPKPSSILATNSELSASATATRQASLTSSPRTTSSPSAAARSTIRSVQEANDAGVSPAQYLDSKLVLMAAMAVRALL